MKDKGENIQDQINKQYLNAERMVESRKYSEAQQILYDLLRTIENQNKFTRLKLQKYNDLINALLDKIDSIKYNNYNPNKDKLILEKDFNLIISLINNSSDNQTKMEILSNHEILIKDIFQKINSLPINDLKFWFGGNKLSWFSQIITYTNYIPHSELISFMEKILEFDSSNDNVYIQLGILYGENNDNLENKEKSLDYLKKAIEINSDNFKGWYTIGKRFYDNEEYNDAILHFSKALAIYEENNSANYNILLISSIYRMVGNAYQIQNKFEEAEEYYLKSLDFEDENWTYFAYGLLKLNQNSLLNAEEFLEIAYKSFSDPPKELFHLLALISDLKGNSKLTNFYFNSAVITDSHLDQVEKIEKKIFEKVISKYNKSII